MTADGREAPPFHLDAAQAAEFVADGALLVDVRGERSRERDGLIEHAVVVPKRSIVERFGRLSRERLTIGDDQAVVVFCTTELGSSKCVPIIRSLGVARVFGVRGGFRDLAASGLFRVLSSS